MLYDKAKVYVQAGAGGNGCTSFRREAHVPRGGPDGGDGGRGGDVVLLCDDSRRDLQSFKRKAQYRAQRGGHGEGSLRHGADGESLVLKVPPGTQAQGEDGSFYDLTVPGQRVVITRGGQGGRGNKQFTNATRQAPRFSEHGQKGEEGSFELQLKLLADVGLMGLPNAGKSSLLRQLTRAQPKVAEYPFTTLEPQLGTITYDERQLILADIPGLIEGASEGAGLGHDFLAHIERTRLLVHVLDLAPLDGSDPIANYETVERELVAHNPRLAELPRIIALSKADLVPTEDVEWAAGEWRERAGLAVIATSSATGQGLEEFKGQLFKTVDRVSEESLTGPVTGRRPSDLASSIEAIQPAPPARSASESGGQDEQLAEYRIYRPASGKGFEVEKVTEKHFRLSGRRVEALIERFDIDNDEALAYVEKTLHKIGVIDALLEAGFNSGDTVEINEITFDLSPES